MSALVVDDVAARIARSLEDLEPDDYEDSHLLVGDIAPDHPRRRRRRLQSGAAFVLDESAELEPLWGTGEEVLWARGESLLLCGPTGVGKTTLATQLVKGLLGLSNSVLGLPVTPADRPVLYLALDRPKQARRAMRRLFSENDRGVLEDRLRVWEGPLSQDLGKSPSCLVQGALRVGVGVVVIDSLKDAAVRLAEDEPGGNLNRAIQLCLAEGIEVMGLHHQRKGQNGSKPTKLEDVYGSTWITAGAGSVLLLWGAAGDPVVEMSHLKQPAAPVGPLKIEHDHHAGISTVLRGQVDVLVMLRNAPGGLTATDVARTMFSKDAPTDNERKKAQRHLDRLVRENLAHREDWKRHPGTGNTPAKYHAVTLQEAP